MDPSDPRMVDGMGLWLDSRSCRDWQGAPGLFLDRDGVIVCDTGYLSRPAEVCLVDGAGEAIRWANEAGIPVAVITNQSGIGRGYYSWQDFSDVQGEISRHLEASGAHLDFVAACAFHPDATSPFKVSDHPWRKPNAGMIVAIAERAKIELGTSVVVGNRWTDLMAGARSGMGIGIMIEAELHRTRTPRPRELSGFQTEYAVDLKGAVDFLRSRAWPPTAA